MQRSAKLSLRIGRFCIASLASAILFCLGCYIHEENRWGQSQDSVTFLLAGGGALVFKPTANDFGATTQAKAAFLYGGGIDYNLTRVVGLRLQYRGLVYGAPDFGLVGASTGAGHLAEPSVGLVFHLDHLRSHI